MAGQDLNRIARTYDAVARAYAEAFAGEHEKKPMDQQVLGRFARELGDRRPVWDLGCGPGQTTRYLTDLGIEISGLDLSAEILEQARTSHPRLHFQRGDLLALDFEDGSVAGAVAFYSIVHFTKEQVETALREVHRVLTPGGLLLLSYHVGEETIHIDEFLGEAIDINFMFFTVDFISGCLKQSGFTELETIERAPYPKVEYESRRAYVFATKPP